MKIRNVLVIPFLLLVLTAVSCGNFLRVMEEVQRK